MKIIPVSQINEYLRSLSEEGEEGGAIGYRSLELYPPDRTLEPFVPLYIQFEELIKSVKNAKAKGGLELALRQFGDILQKAYAANIGFAPDTVLPTTFNQYKL